MVYSFNKITPPFELQGSFDTGLYLIFYAFSTGSSLDLNLIENFWGLMVPDVYKDGRQYSSVYELKPAVKNPGNNISVCLFEKLVFTILKGASKSCRNLVKSLALKLY